MSRTALLSSLLSGSAGFFWGCVSLMQGCVGRVGLGRLALGRVGFAQACVLIGLVLGSQVAVAQDETLDRIDRRFAEGFDQTPPDFQRHVVPLLGRLGCNGRSCHGSFQGQGGFQLSLFGYDFAADHAAMLDPAGPRVDLDQPLKSLVYSKPSSDVDHEGGQRFVPGSWEARVLEQWLTAGAPGTEQLMGLRELRVEPAELQFQQAGESAQLRAIAVWNDGTREDVTPLCRFRTNDDQIATIDENGLVGAREPGDTHVVVFYDKAVVPVPVIRPVGPEWGENYPQVPTPTAIDAHVVEKLRKLGIVPSPVADDATFLRRLSLDLTGTLPTPDEVREFCADTDPLKRSQKIEQLLDSPAYVAWWTTLLCDITGNNSEQLNNTLPFRDQASKDWYEWIFHRVEQNVPYDELVAGIVTARSLAPGQSYTEYSEQMCEIYRAEGELGFAQLPSMPHYWTRQNFRESEDRAIHFAYAFMGIRIQCAQCHKHPFDQWSKADFDSFAKFFEQVAFDNSGRSVAPEEFQALVDQLGIEEQRGNQFRQQLPRLLEQGLTIPFPVVDIREPRRPNARQRMNRGNRPPANTLVSYDLLGLAQFELAADQDAREPLMQWLRAPENPYFARAFVNRVWSVYFGTGIVHPTDDLSLANPPSNGPLLDYLAQGFIESGFDMKWLHREITQSNAYQSDWRTNSTNASDHRNFSHALPRRLPAEVVMDSLRQATAGDTENAEFRMQRSGHATSIPGTRFAGRTAGLGYALQVFGRSTRETTCDCDRADDPSLLQTVFLYNDRDVHALLRREEGWIASVAQQQQAAQQQLRDEQARAAQQEARNRRDRSRTDSLEALRSQKRMVEQRLEQARKNENQTQIERFTRRLSQIERELAQLRSRQASEELEADQELMLSEAGQLEGDEDNRLQEQATAAAEAMVAQRREWIEEAYLRTLSRLPSESERVRCEQFFEESPQPSQGLEGLLWVLINTKEFLVNH